MKDGPENKKKTCIFANISLALLLISLVLFVYALVDLVDDICYWIGGGLVLLGFPMAVFSVKRICRSKEELAGKKRAWTAVILGFILFSLCLLSWWGSTRSWGFWGTVFRSLIFFGIIAVTATLGLIWRRFGPTVSVGVLSILVGLVAWVYSVWFIVHIFPDFGPLPLNPAILFSGFLGGVIAFTIVWVCFWVCYGLLWCSSLFLRWLISLGNY